MNELALNLAALEVLAPLAGAVALGLFGKTAFSRQSGVIGAATVGLSFIFSLIVFIALVSLPAGARVHEIGLYEWIASGSLVVNIGLRVDILSATVSLVITFVAFMIHVYSIGYMHGDEGKWRFFAYMNLFTAAMLLLVLANSLIVMFIGWEGVGFCSYILIGFWFHKNSAADAGKKAFIVTRLGDAAFVIGILAVYYIFGTFEIGKVIQAIHDNAPIMPWFASKAAPVREVLAAATPIFGASLATVVAFLFLSGAIGKSAQIPLYVWLPDAMEGPTPVSALIHAATMVTAGVYLIARWNFLFVLAPFTLEVVAIIGAVTALFAATMALAQYDIKRVLAYSTISQIGYMFVALGVASFSGAIFHFMTHAFFKALLFMGAGSVMHCLAGELDMRKMGALRRVMPVTFITFLIAALSISGIPGLAGFFSKDAIIWQSVNPENGLPGSLRAFLWGLSVITAILTAFYMFRAVFLTFCGESRVVAKGHLREPRTNPDSPLDRSGGLGLVRGESPRVMTIPLIVLAVFSIVAGYASVPPIFGGHDWFSGFVGRGIFEKTATMINASQVSESLLRSGEWFSTIVCTVLAVLSILFAWYIYLRNASFSEEMMESAAPIFRTIYNKYYVDEAYHAVFVRGCYGVAWLCLIVDTYGVDGLALGIAWLAERTGQMFRRLQDGDAQSYAIAMAVGLLLLFAAFFLFM